MIPTFKNSTETPCLLSIKWDIDSFIQSEGFIIKFWLYVVLVKFEFEADLKYELVNKYPD